MDVTNRLDIAELYSGKDLVVVISGGGTGIGLAYASALAQTSAKRVYILGRRLNKLEEAAKSIDASGNVVVPVECDVTNQTSVVKVVARVNEEFGYLDVLINNAGRTGPLCASIYKADSIDKLQEALLTDWDEWSPTLEINITAVMGMSARFLPLLDEGNKRRGWQSGRAKAGEPRSRDTKALAQGIEESDLRTSQIITTSSIAGFNRTITAGAAYTASKAGATMLGKTMATFLSPFGIRSNIIAPGIYPSEMTTHLPDALPIEIVPASRKGSFEEMAGSILHLVGRSGSYLNGVVLVTDGGRLGVMQSTY